MSDKQTNYFDSNVLVDTAWVAANLENPTVRIIESNEDPLLYRAGHIPGAIEIDWTRDLNDPIVRDYIDKVGFQALLESNGITNETTCVFYGDKSNWWACYAFWVFQLFGHTNAKIMNGGSMKWVQEQRELTKEIPAYKKTSYVTAHERDDVEIRARRDAVLAHIANPSAQLVDVRSTEEFTGERLHIPGYPNEGALRGGHIQGAKSVPWSRAVNEDGTFKSFVALKELYEVEQNLSKDENTIVYCRIGERSSHTWFVLKYLLGYPNVRNYDGSWTEWGNLVGVPIAK